MTERNVANIGQTRYAQYEGAILMSEDKSENSEGHNISEPAVEPAHGKLRTKPFRFPPVDSSPSISPELGRAIASTLERVEAQEKDSEKPKIPYERAAVAIQVLDDIRQKNSVVIDVIDIDDFKSLIEKYSKGKDRGDVRNELAGLEPEEIILKLDKIISGAEIVPPESESGFWAHTYDAPHRKTEEEFVESQIEKARSFAEEPISNLKIRECQITVLEESRGDFVKEGTLGAGKYSYGWDSDFKSIDKGLSGYARRLAGFRELADTDDVSELVRLSKDLETYREHLGSMVNENPDRKDARDIDKLVAAAAEGLLKIGEKAQMISAIEEARRGGDRGKVEKIQRIYYGESTIPTLESIDAREKEFSEQAKSTKVVVDKLGLDDAKRKTLKGLNRAQIELLGNGKWKEGLKLGISEDSQKEIYAALKRDQEDWFYKKIDTLPLSEMDLSKIAGTVEYKEITQAQTHMVKEMAKIAESITFGYEMTYYFENGGFDAMMQRAGALKNALEIMSTEVIGWDEVLASIEELITRKAEAGENIKRKFFLHEFNKADRAGRLKTGDRLIDLRYQYQKDPTKVTRGDLEFLKRTAVGRYIYEENADGSVKYERPKTADEIEQDKKILGLVLDDNDKIVEIGESWKVGGLVGVEDDRVIRAVRNHLTEKAEAVIRAKAKDKGINEGQIDPRSRIAAHMAEWVYWRMLGRSAYWMEQGGNKKGLGGGKGEFDMFLVLAFQRFAVQESKGSDEGGRVMRKIMFGADTKDQYVQDFVPGEAGGENFNLGIFDYFGQYAAVNPGERGIKPLQKAGFVRGVEIGQGDWINNIISRSETLKKRLQEQGWGPDRIEEELRNSLSDEEKDKIENYNNRPIVSLANNSSRAALARIASGEINPWGDITDFFGGDFKGPDELRKLMGMHDVGFLSNPNESMIREAAKLSEGRKRVWQRAKIAKDMMMGMLKFKTKHNRLVGADNWSSEDIDTSLTNLRNDRIYNERAKLGMEKEIYKYVSNGFDRLIPFIEVPAVHKLFFNYDKKPAKIAWEFLLGIISEFLKRLPSQLTQR